MTCNLTAKQLDAQSPIPLDGWLDMNSEECKDKDNNQAFTRKCLRIGMEEGFMHTDSLGRIWCLNNEDVYCPFHFSYGKKLYGFRLAAKAAN